MTCTKIVATDEVHLRDLITSHIQQYGVHCSLNHIDTHQIQSMSELFAGIDFQGDISEWDTYNVQSMKKMFMSSTFNGDISKWNVQKVRNTEQMFEYAKFTGDISAWSFDHLEYSTYMFRYAKIKHPIQWTTPNLKDANSMFERAAIEAPICIVTAQMKLRVSNLFWHATTLYMPQFKMHRGVDICYDNIFDGTNIPMHEQLLHSPLLLSKNYQPTYAYYIETFAKMFNKTKDECELQLRKQLSLAPTLRVEHFVWNILKPGMYEGPLWTKELNDFVQAQTEVLQGLGQDIIWSAPDIFMLWLQRIQKPALELDIDD